MPKAHSPIRLDEGLMKEAKLAAELETRTPAEQIEYWANIGRSVSKMMDREDIVRVVSGASQITLEQANDPYIDADEVFAQLETERSDGTLAHKVSLASTQYRASGKSGLIEAVDANGDVRLGRFSNGEFVEV